MSKVSVIGKRFSPNGPFSAFFNDFEIFNGPFIIILYILLWAIFQVNGTMAHGPLLSQSLPKQCVLIGNIITNVKLWIDDVNLSVRPSTYCQWFPLRYDKWYQKQMFAKQYNKQKQITRESMFITTQKYRFALQNSTFSFTHCEQNIGWKYNFKGENSATHDIGPINSDFS